MANEWNVAEPGDHTKIGNLPSHHRARKGDVKEVLEKEHTDLGDDNSGCWHRKGSAKSYHADYSGGLPQTRPDDATAITDDDDGRFAYDTNDNRLMMQTDHANGDDDDYTQVGGKVLGEADMASDSETELATQHSIKAYVDGQWIHKVLVKTQADTPYTVIAADLKGNTTIVNTGATGALVLDLPDMTVGDKLRVLVTAAQSVSLNPHSSDNFRLFTQTTTANKDLSSSTVGAMISIVGGSGSTWIVNEIAGVWDEEA